MYRRWTYWSSSRLPRPRPSASISAPASPCWPPMAMSATCRPRTARSARTRTSPWTGRSIAQSQKRLDAIAKAVTKGGKLYLATDPDREGEAISWHVLRRAGAQEGAGRASTSSGSPSTPSPSSRCSMPIAHPRDLDQRADRRLPGAPRARLPGRLHPVAGAVAQAAGQPLGRPRPVGGAAPDLRARGRDRGLQDPRILDGRGPVRHRQEADAQGPPDPSRRPASSTSSTSTPRSAPSQAKREIERRAFAVAVDRPPPGPPQPAAALHHLDPAAGSLAQARRRRRHAPCASPRGSTRASTSAARRSA